MSSRSICAFVLVFASGCGTETAVDSSDAGTSLASALQPLTVGSHWSYQVTDDSDVSIKTNTISTIETVGGTGPNATLSAYRFDTTTDNETDRSVSWMGLENERVVRYRELAYSKSTGLQTSDTYFSPARLRIDESAEHIVSGAQWQETFTEVELDDDGTTTTTEKTEIFRVDGVNQTVTVPAGTFSNAIVVLKASSGDTTKSYWFVPGVGKVKESGGQVEELTSYEIAE